ncbi:MAG: ribonuclease P protein component [Candidatus Dormibacteraceae bacterium]
MRLVRRSDFQRVLRSRRLLAGQTIVAFAIPDPRPAPGGARTPVRVGVAAARRIPGAVSRNRAKRRVREAVRVTLAPGLGGREMGRPYDVVVIARPSALRAPLDQIAGEVRTVWERLPG